MSSRTTGVTFNIYTNAPSIRGNWSRHQRNISPKAEHLFRRMVRHTTKEITRITPKKTGRLRRGLQVQIRGFLKVSFKSDVIDPKTGEHYSWTRHEYPAKKYTTTGTTHKFIERPFKRATARLNKDLELIYMNPGHRVNTYF